MWVERRMRILEIALDMIDRGLSRTAGVRFGSAGKATGKQHRGRLRHDHDPVAHLASHQVGRCRLAAPWSAREHNPMTVIGMGHE